MSPEPNKTAEAALMDAVTAPTETTAPQVEQTPAEPTTPSPTEKVLSIEDFESDVAETVKPVKPIATPAPAPTEAVTTEIVEPTAPVAPQPPAQDAQRDYSIFPPELVPKLKKARNDVFNAVKEVYLPLKQELDQKSQRLTELEKGALPESYYEHPEAYRFDPVYQKTSAFYQQAAAEADFWTKQFEDLEAGEDSIQILEGYDAEGKPVARKVAVTSQNLPQLKAMVNRSIMTVEQAKQAAYSEVRSVALNFRQNHQKTVQYLQGAEDKFFPAYKEVEKTPRAKDYNFFTSQFLPPAMRNHPLARGLGKAYCHILDLQDQLKAANDKLALAQHRAAGASISGPSPSELAGSTPISTAGGRQPGVLSVKDFEDGDE